MATLTVSGDGGFGGGGTGGDGPGDGFFSRKRIFDGVDTAKAKTRKRKKQKKKEKEKEKEESKPSFSGGWVTEECMMEVVASIRHIVRDLRPNLDNAKD